MPPGPVELLRTPPAQAPPPLTGADYARAHAVYEAASDQRAAVRRLLVRDVPPLVAGVPPGRPLRVLGVGVGDGSVDAPLAAALARRGAVEYTGVEPHPPSAAAFAERLAALRAPGLAVEVVPGAFDRAVRVDPVDLVHFVHSLYYVPDLDDAVDTALALLRPGGVLVALTAPLDPLCALGRALRPSGARGEWLADDVRAALAARGLPLRASTLTARLDVRSLRTDPAGVGEQVLDFLVQARTAHLPAATRADLLAHLDAIALPGAPGFVPHPLEVVVARVP